MGPSVDNFEKCQITCARRAAGSFEIADRNFCYCYAGNVTNNVIIREPGRTFYDIGCPAPGNGTPPPPPPPRV